MAFSQSLWCNFGFECSVKFGLIMSRDLTIQFEYSECPVFGRWCHEMDVDILRLTEFDSGNFGLLQNGRIEILDKV